MFVWQGIRIDEGMRTIHGENSAHVEATVTMSRSSFDVIKSTVEMLQDLVVCPENAKGPEGIEIITPGDMRRAKKVKRFTCERCGCVWEADNEHYEDVSTQREGPDFKCKCPTCGKVCYTQYSPIP